MTKKPLISGVAGVILAGGSSTRFGTNKALALLNGKHLINHAASKMNKIFKERFLVTNTPGTYDFIGWQSTKDIYKKNGPLAGIHAALHTIKEPRAFVVGCDLPFLNEDLIRFLCSLSGKWDVVIPDLENGPEPLYAVYSKKALPVIEASLKQGERKVSKVIAKLRVRRVSQKEILSVVKDLKTFHNINRPRDLSIITSQKTTNQLNLQEAQKVILSKTKLTKTETVALQDALCRVPCKTIKAKIPVPQFPQATMDGFVVSNREIKNASPKKPAHLKITGEIPAGCTDIPTLKKGETLRIMTGGMVPPRANQVIPFEKCQEHNNTIVITPPLESKAHIRKPGSSLKKNQTIVRSGTPLQPDHMPILATAGISKFSVYKKTLVGILCTGSELIDVSQAPKAGQLISGNRFLLNSLVKGANALPVDLGIVADRTEDIVKTLRSGLSSNFQIIITTGGMGPGKYDLVTKAFKKLGVNIIYQSLNIRPGKATIFGTLKNTLFFGLPGPPPAVRILFNELLRPALLQAQGYRKPLPSPVRATLSESVPLKQKGIMNLKCGIMTNKQGKIFVRLAQKHEPINCIMLLPSHRRSLKRGEIITVHQTNY